MDADAMREKFERFAFAPGGPLGPGGPFGPDSPFGPGGPFGDARQWGRHGWQPFAGPRARRGDVRAAVLTLLAERPMNGYQVIQEIKERSGGLWKPSSGAVYPALQQLEDEGLVQAGDHEGRRAFSLTAAGRTYVEEHPDELAAPWVERFEQFDLDAGAQAMELRELAGQAIGAFMQVVLAGTPQQVEQAKQVISDARRALYRILAEDEPTGKQP
jgi:DNA-binding PadR family transcriptional regulator